MVRKFAALFALILTLGMAAAPVAAQGVDTTDLENVGLQSGFARTYAADPAAEGANPELLAVMIAGFEFDDAATVDEAFEDFSCGFAGGFFGVEDALDCDGLVDEGFEVADVDGIGDQAIEVSGEASISGATAPVSMLALQSDNYLFVVISLGDSTPGIGDPIGTLLANAEPSDTEVMFSADGTSTGGMFDMMPQEGDAEIEGFIPVDDMDFLDTGATDVSTPVS